ncbi:MAG: metabolite traffic protein EboE [Rhodobacterales bacterium]|nr:metabolite traffic protein EboE [Rhodobacterales bacterium]
MHLPGPQRVDLTYCTNIHPGETWDEVRETLAVQVPSVRDRVAPGQRFGVGLRLSARAAEALSAPEALADLRALLAEKNLYVFTLNGFPYGPFHGQSVKESVYRPDWTEPERLRYTNKLSDILAVLLEDEPGVTGSISTVPGAFKDRVAGPADVVAMATAMRAQAAHLVDLHRRTGRTIVLALEPEPCCFLETVDEAVVFFRDHLYADPEDFAAQAGLAPAEGTAALRRHLGLCYDTCHGAVEFEDPAQALAALAAAGIPVAKIQVSAGLRLPAVGPDTPAHLAPYGDEVYLHQVVVRGADGALTRFTDLPPALAALDGQPGAEWRVHFHVPVFLEDLGPFASTQPFLRQVLALQAAGPVTPHLEVETYTWGVLPPALRQGDLADNIARELTWTLEAL